MSGAAMENKRQTNNTITKTRWRVTEQEGLAKRNQKKPKMPNTENPKRQVTKYRRTEREIPISELART